MTSRRFGRQLVRGRAFPLVILVLACSLVGCGSANRLLWQRDAPPPETDPFWGAADRDPTPETLCATAALLAKQGRVADSERLLRRTVAEFPSYAPAYCTLAESH
ncbi:hypothetical protein ACFL09_00605, partial [Planctomycetota bacterium]